MYINIHTHQLKYSLDIKEVLNLILTPQKIPQCSGNYYTVGVHPWWCFENGQNFFDQLEKLIQNPMCVGLGEIGLDKVKGSNWQNQLWCFEQQLKFANLHEIPLVVIHSVKAYKEIWDDITKSGFKGAILFHDYNGDVAFTKNALQRPRTYFSYGASLFRNSSAGLESLAFIPRYLFLLETDDQEKKTIEQVYQRATEVLMIPMEQLKLDIKTNATMLLGRSI
jgi:TatD DNase family protein